MLIPRGVAWIPYSEQFVGEQIPLPEEYVSDRNARKV